MHPLAGIAAGPCAAELLLTALLIAAALHGGLGATALRGDLDINDNRNNDSNSIIIVL